MSVTHRHARTFKRGTDSEVAAAVEVTCESEVLIHQQTIADGTTNQVIAANIDFSAMNSFYVKASVAMTLETNDGTTPTDTISLPAGKAVQWYTGSVDANPLTADVTNFYITNASGGSGTLEIYAGHSDATP